MAREHRLAGASILVGILAAEPIYTLYVLVLTPVVSERRTGKAYFLLGLYISCMDLILFLMFVQ